MPREHKTSVHPAWVIALVAAVADIVLASALLSRSLVATAIGAVLLSLAGIGCAALLERNHFTR